ncbi:MAG: glycosyltransferase family 4 protein [Cyanobacteria bacterium J06554_11]
MRIAVIGSKGLPPHQGGIEHHCAEVYPRMVEAGHRVDLYARSSYNHNGRVRSYKGVNVITVPSIQVKGIDALACSGIATFMALRKDYDIVHFHALGPSLFTLLPKFLSRAKVLTTCHGLDWQRAKWGALSSRVIKTGEQNAVRYADQVVVVSEALQAYFLKQYGLLTKYIENAPVAYTATDAQFCYGQELGISQGKYLLFLGRLVPEKRIDLLLQAFQALQPGNQLQDWKLVLVGDKSDTGPFTSQLLQLADNNPNIIFTGELQGSLLAEIVRNAGLFVLPSDIEGLPLALLEAMQEKIPVVVSDIPVHRQMIGHDRGLIFRAGDLANLQTQLVQAISQPGKMKQMARNAAKYVERHHNWDNITNKYLSLYASLSESQPETQRVPVSLGSKLP